ncbi:16S rRNA (uracil(1498)-N(3))-methyltransferase [soil metagenome]
MKLHRFYVGNDIELKHNFWVHDSRLLHQWLRVLRLRSGEQIVLFDGVTHDRLYKILETNEREAHLQHVTDFERKLPKKEVFLLWSLLKKDKNDWVLQKCTELGVSHFWPLLAERSEKTGFNIERAQKIAIEASEQCGRSDIPSIREAIHIQAALDDLKDKAQIFICEQTLVTDDRQLTTQGSAGILIGPEGGWSDNEKEQFEQQNLSHLSLHDFTLRAETAAVAAVTKLLQ